MKTDGEGRKCIEVLPAALPESLVGVVQQRLAQRRRAAVVKAVAEALAEFKAGKLRPASARQIRRRVPA